VLKIRNLKNKIDKIVEDFAVFDCVVYFLAGYLYICIIIDINVILLKIYINEIGT